MVLIPEWFSFVKLKEVNRIKLCMAVDGFIGTWEGIKLSTAELPHDYQL
jgi:hypothetical protein